MPRCVKNKRTPKRRFKKRVAINAVPSRVFAPPKPKIFKYFYPQEPFRVRKVLHVRDLMDLLCKNEAGAKRFMRLVRIKYLRPKLPFIKVKDFCRYTGVNEEEIQQYFRIKDQYEYVDAIMKRNAERKANNQQ
jgi:hypothetical protein